MAEVKIGLMVCFLCNKQILAWKHAVKKAIKNTGYWACKPCTLTERNKKNALPVGTKRINNKGRILIKTSTGWEQEHRYVMKNFINRNLYEDEIVHHIDENKMNNDITNLILMNHGEHTVLHHAGSKRSNETREKISQKAKERRLNVS